MKSPLMSAWLSAANSAAGATRGVWTAEMRRQQAAMAREIVRAASGAAPASKPRAGVKRTGKPAKR